MSDEYDLNYAKRALFILAPIAIMVMYTEAMLIPSLPTIASDFGVNSATVSWVLTAYLISGVVANPIVGKLGDIYGKKKILVVVMSIYAVAVTLNGFAPNFDAFVAFRVLQGIGLGMFPLAFSLIREEFPPKMVPKAQGTVSAMFGIGSAISLPIAGYIAQTFGWQYTYHTVIPVVILLDILTIKYIRESRFVNRDSKIDYLGAAMMGISLTMLTLGFSEAPTWGWTSLEFFSVMALGGILFASFIFYQSRAKFPLISTKLLSRRNVLVANLAALVAGISMFMAYQSLSYLYELPTPVGFGLDILSTGLLLLPVSLMQIVGAAVASRSVVKSGTKPVLVGASALVSVFYFLLGLVSINGSNAGELSITFLAAMMMLGSAMLNVVLINVLTFSIERKFLGVATGMNTVFRLIGGAFGPSIAGSLLATYYSYRVYPMTVNGVTSYMTVKLPTDFAFQATFFIAAGVGLVMVLIALMSRNIDISKIPEKQVTTNTPTTDVTVNKSSNTGVSQSEFNFKGSDLNVKGSESQEKNV
ncbi:Multidrug resistance protein MdtL [Sulfuracidifex tepidarius]|uniref:Multidrug resistance protein MdtL n=1 Tax=Sulfuracidifex tepidarius TaxID=1294262 RepID=A0A510DY81_9CREN|nr:MFS transporter [Sulfuracidifex tepidarius]BBG25184.1 Multidrug resistance protein MdtL [Sulfuracidifex tepidarius]